ncbi:MAG: TetR/AcrR family transcriptional regulator [Massilia sp.]
MRKSQAEAAETRQQIVKLAANAFRLNGITATGIVPLMAQAGLTQGGFYKHFASKDQLVAEACTVGVAGLVQQFREDALAGGEQGFASIVGSYLSAGHRANREQGCPLAAMGSELVRGDEQTRAAAFQGFKDLVDVMAQSLGSYEPEQARSHAIFAMAAMVGALTMARMIPDETTSSAGLESVQQHLRSI